MLSNKKNQENFKARKKKLGLIRCDDIYATPVRKAEFKKIAKADETKLREG